MDTKFKIGNYYKTTDQRNAYIIEYYPDQTNCIIGTIEDPQSLVWNPISWTSTGVADDNVYENNLVEPNDPRVGETWMTTDTVQVLVVYISGDNRFLVVSIAAEEESWRTLSQFYEKIG